ncbi:hypothetical protein WG66_004740 [Moniliophthora roreri]|nr:hypothetical protein WG66_004740 [Moniliophthora roreri]
MSMISIAAEGQQVVYAECLYIAGAILCFIILAMIGIAGLHPVSKPHLDRVSFRILIYALVANMVYAISVVVEQYHQQEKDCAGQMWLILFTLNLSAYLPFCIGLNLQLVLIHKINGQRMEKFYILGSVLLALAVTLSLLFKGQLGWSPVFKTCWYTSTDLIERLKWQVGVFWCAAVCKSLNRSQIGTQIIWNILVFLGEVVAFSSVVIFMVRNKVFDRGLSSRGAAKDPSSRWSVSRPKAVRPAQYRNIVLRIALYPLTALITLSLSTFCALYISVTVDRPGSGPVSQSLLIVTIFNGLRPIAYALLAATDPSLIRGLLAIRHAKNGPIRSNLSCGRFNSRTQFTTQLGIEEATSGLGGTGYSYSASSPLVSCPQPVLQIHDTDPTDDGRIELAEAHYSPVRNADVLQSLNFLNLEHI